MKLPNFEKYYTTADSLRYGKFSLDNLVLKERPIILDVSRPQVQMFINCDSKYFRDMFNAMLEPENHYVTYADDIIKAHALYRHSILPMESVAVILKNTTRERQWIVSDIARKVANLIGLPTAYSKSLYIAQRTYTLTVDYVKYGEYFFDLKGFFAYKDNLAINTLRMACNRIKNNIRDLQRETKVPIQQRDKLARQFLPIYFFRKYIISDKSFFGDKVGVIYNTRTREYNWAPCYDMEDSFSNYIRVLPKLEQDVIDAVQLYPAETAKLMNNYRNILDQDKIFSILKDDLSDTDAFIFSSVIKHRILLIINIYDYAVKLN